MAALILRWFSFWAAVSGAPPNGGIEAELVFPLRSDHNHAPSIVECPNGDLLVSWYRGSGERKADDVAVYGSRRRRGSRTWESPFILADTPGFPDGNTAMHIDDRERLWLFWPVVLANTWESCLTNYRVSSDYGPDGAPRWDWQGVLYLKPLDFEEAVAEGAKVWVERFGPDVPGLSRLVEKAKHLAPEKLDTRLGWQPRSKPTRLPSGRIVLPLYSDTFSASIMALSDDGGETWRAGRPLVGFGNIQPSVLRRDDGTLVAYMRENGPVDRIRVAESTDDGVTWGPVGALELENPGSGLDALRLLSGKWLLVYNDTARGRRSLAVSLSDDEGRSWRWTRHLERHEAGEYHYPAVIQARDGTVHVAYSYFVEEGKSIKHAAFRETWITEGEP